MTKGYIFDYGGTLDTGGCHWGKVLWHAYQQRQVPVTETQFREAYVHAERTLGSTPLIQSDFTFRQTLATKIRLQMDFLGLRGYETMLTDAVYSGTLAHTRHSCEVLQQLSGCYPMVLVSNFYGNIRVVLHEFGFDGLFMDVIESAVVGIRKPDPRIFSLGVRALGLEPHEVTVVGDSIEKDIVPARQAGCHTTWIQGEQWTDAPIDRSVPDRVICDLSELLEK